MGIILDLVDYFFHDLIVKSGNHIGGIIRVHFLELFRDLLRGKTFQDLFAVIFVQLH